jgi:DNA processing protein
MEEDIIYQLALSKVSGIGPAYARKLIRHFGEAKPVFSARQPELEKICGAIRASAVMNFKGFHEIEKELSFLQRYSMRSLFITDKDYPRRLRDCEDMPVLLFYKGSADLNASRVVAIVGTRSPTQYGKQATQRLVKDLASASAAAGMVVVSGLAYGIDAIAHQAAFDNDLPTVGILGHGLDRIYPQQNASLAKKMVSQGGLLTQFNIGTKAENHNFPVRNRIVAGMSDALIVVETDIRGGSMLTVKNALGYKKKVFALPGRINDTKSAGCNALIRSGKATLLVNAGQLLQDLKWDPPVTRSGVEQTTLFPAPADESNLSENERKMLQLIRERGGPSFDELYSVMVNGPSRSELTMVLLNLELKGWIHSLPGKIYRLRE